MHSFDIITLKVVYLRYLIVYDSSSIRSIASNHCITFSSIIT
jgi:hypothetical protein